MNQESTNNKKNGENPFDQNPFDNFSSRIRRLNYFLPSWKDSQNHKKHGTKDAFIGREDILYRLRTWILSDVQTGSFLVAGYRGMGKSSFVEKALYNITRQKRRSSHAEFTVTILQVLTLALGCIFSIEGFIWSPYVTAILWAMGICFIYVYSYLLKYHIRYFMNYMCFYWGLVCYIFGKVKFKNESENSNDNSNDKNRKYRDVKSILYDLKNSLKECIYRLSKLDAKDRSRLNKTLFNDFRKKTFQRIAIHINLGHDILTERDIMCLITKRIKTEVESFISNKHLHFMTSYLYIVLCCSLALLIVQTLYSSVFPAINEVYVNYINGIINTPKVIPNGVVQITQSNSLIQTALIYCNDILYKLRSIPLLQPMFYVITYLSVYWAICKILKISFKYIPGINQYELIKRKLEILTERIDTVIDEEISPVAETNQSIINISFGRKKKKNYPLAGVREVEYELIDILGHFNRIYAPFTLEFVIVFDELDKVDPENDIKEKEDDVPSFTDKNQSNAFSGGTSSRERKENVLRLLANMKHFISTARAKFIFISGRELYDAYLAGLSDREFAISSVFCGAIYVESFLTSNRAQMDVSSMTEQYLCKMLLPKKYLEKIIKEKYYRYGIITQEVPSLKWYSRYLYEQMQEEKKREELTQFEEWELNNSIMFLRYFSIYLTHISNGSPQKILSYFRMYIRTQDNLYRKNTATPTIYGLNSSKKKMSETYVLTFNYVNQQKIAFIFYMAYPTMQAIINNATQYGDKLLISASFLMNHIYKYHSYSFSWRNLEQAPELLEVYRTPELRTFLHSILSFMVHTHMTNIPSGLYNFKFRKSISNEIAIFSKLSEEVSAIFNFTLDESLSVKKHYTRLMKHYTDLLQRGNSNEEHYSILLSRIHQVLGDLQLTDENYLESALEYRSSIVYLKKLLLQHKGPEEFVSGDIMLPLIRNMLKLGLTYERRKTNNSAYVVYYELICMLIDFRYVDETKLGMRLKVKKTQDWRDKTYVLYKENSLGKRDNSSPSLTKQDETRESYNFQKEIESQLLPAYEDNSYYEIEGDQLILGLSRILTPEKTNIIFRLSLLEDLRLVYQAILAKLFVLEKVELGGITKVNVDVAESEFRYLYRVTNIQDKFIILVDFFRRLAEILYYKNGLMNRNMDLFVTGLYFWGYEFNTDIEEYCRKNNLGSAQQLHIEKSLNEIQWSVLDITKGDLNPLTNYEEQWKSIKEKLLSLASKKGDKTLKGFLTKWNIKTSYVKKISYFKVNECNDHRKKICAKGYSIPCFACRYYTRSMHILLEYLFDEKENIEDSVSKVRVFLKKVDQPSNLFSLRTNYLQTVAIVLDGMGNVQLSCSDKDSMLNPDFLKELSNLSDDNHEFEVMNSLNSLEKSILYFWAASRYYRKGVLLKDASICLKKILHLLKRYMMVEEKSPSKDINRITKLSEYLVPIIDNISRKAILYLYAHNENISIAEIQDLKGLFSLKPYEDISLENLSLYPDIEEIVMLSMELKLFCYRAYEYNFEKMPDDFKKDETKKSLKLYSLRLSSIFFIEKTVQQRMVVSRMKAIWNYNFLDYIFKGMGLNELYENGDKKVWRYQLEAPIIFYQRFINFLEQPLSKSQLELFGFNLKNCGLEKDVLSIKNKLLLVEFLLKDSMFCLIRVLSVLTTNSSQLLHTNSYIAETYRMMFEWTQIFKFLYSIYEYTDTKDQSMKNKIRDSMYHFITSRRLSMEIKEDPDRNYQKTIKEVLNKCSALIEKSDHMHNTDKRSTIFYNTILKGIDPTNLQYIISNYSGEMALQYYRRTKEMHAEGNTYKEVTSELFYLDDDLQNDTEQFYLAMERYLINCGYIDDQAKALKDIYSKSSIYSVKWYESDNHATTYHENRRHSDDLWGLNI